MLSLLAAKAHDLQQKAQELVAAKETVQVEGRQLQLVKQLAEGGFGFVYLARDAGGKEYALKRMLAQEREADLAAAVARLTASTQLALDHVRDGTYEVVL